MLPHFFFLTVSIRLKPKSTGVLQRFDASRSARQAASRCQRCFGSFPVGVFVGRHHDCCLRQCGAPQFPRLRICWSPNQTYIQSQLLNQIKLAALLLRLCLPMRGSTAQQKAPGIARGLGFGGYKLDQYFATTGPANAHLVYRRRAMRHDSATGDVAQIINPLGMGTRRGYMLSGLLARAGALDRLAVGSIS